MKKTILNTFVNQNILNQNVKYIEETLDQYILYDMIYKDENEFKKIPIIFEPHKKEWKDLITPVENQGDCGSCWAFSSVSCLSDRYNILLKKKILNKMLSPTIPIVCNDILNYIFNNDKNLIQSLEHPYVGNIKTINKYACYGNSLIIAFIYLTFYGTYTTKCIPYDININQQRMDNNNIGFNPYFLNNNILFNKKATILSEFTSTTNESTCYIYNMYSNKPFHLCIDSYIDNGNSYYGNPSQNYYCLVYYNIKHVNKNIPYQTYIQYEILKYGPVNSSFVVYEDFWLFDPIKDGIYIHNEKYNNPIGGHAIEIVGWGLFKNKPFWWIKNSFGKNWGINGYFRFFRGNNQCMIETNIIACFPNFNIDYSNIHFINQLNYHLFKSDILKKREIDDNNYINLILKIYYTINSFAYYIDISDINRIFKEYGILTLKLLLTIGFLQLYIPTQSNYDSYDYIIFPGLNYKSNINFNYFKLKDFKASELNTTINSSNQKENNNNNSYYNIIIFSIFIIIMILLFLYKNNYNIK